MLTGILNLKGANGAPGTYDTAPLAKAVPAFAKLPVTTQKWDGGEELNDRIKWILKNPLGKTPAPNSIMLNPTVIAVLVEDCKHRNGMESPYALVRRAEAQYASKKKLPGEVEEIYTYSITSAREYIFNGVRRDATGSLSAISRPDPVGMYMPIMMALRDDKAGFDDLYKKASDVVEKHLRTPGLFLDDDDIEALFTIVYAFESQIEMKVIEVKDVAGNVPSIKGDVKQTLESWDDAQPVFGQWLAPGVVKKPGKITMGELKKEFSSFHNRVWTEEEKQFIPVFPDDQVVPQEIVDFLRAYKATRSSINPMVNFLWMGTTAVGKSTGTRMMATVLNRPYFDVTCYPDIQTENFLANFVPAESRGSLSYKPSFDEICADPETAYLKLTGEDREGISPQEVLDEVIARASDGGSTQRFKLVESDYVKALKNGYLVEIAEISRIREPGVLVGLNGFDRPDAMIRLMDGSYCRRHPDAIVVYTDNIGYSSGRPVDQAVVRRMAMVKITEELPKKVVLDRIRTNVPGFPDSELENMYETWIRIRRHCQTEDITDGDISVMELERWVQLVQIGLDKRTSCIDCIVNKASRDHDERESIKTAVLDVFLK